MAIRRASLAHLVALVAISAGCGRGTPGFVIDQVTISPDTIPIGSTSTQPLKISAEVTDDLHLILSVWATSEGNQIWIDLPQSTTAQDTYSGSIPVSDLSGFPVGDYWFDLHATDDGGREVDLTHAVKLHIS